jgi:hypothetical protein
VKNIEEIIAVVNENEQLAASNLSDPVEEMTNLDYMLENIDGEEAIANDAAFENVMVKMRTYKQAELKDLWNAINIPASSNKTMPFQRTWDSGDKFIQQIDDDSLVYKKRKGEVDSSLPR